MNDTRINSFASVSDLGFSTKKPSDDVPSKSQIDQVAEETGFSRTTGGLVKRRRTRLKTDMTNSFSTRVSDKTLENIYAVADDMRKPLGYVLGIAMDALIEKMSKK